MVHIQNFQLACTRCLLKCFSETGNRLENLEAKVDPRITQRCLGEVKSILPEPKHSSSERCMFKLKKIIYKNGKSAINNLLKNERPLIKNIAECAHNDEKPEISPKITITLYNYITEKVS